MRVRLLDASETDRSSVRCIVVDDQSVASKFHVTVPPSHPFRAYHSCIHPFVKSVSKPCVDSFDLFLLEVKAILVNRD